MLLKISWAIWTVLVLSTCISGKVDPGTTELDKVYLDLTVPLDEIVDEGNSSCVQFVKDALRRSPLIFYSTDLLVSQMWKLTYTTALLVTRQEDRQLMISFRYRNETTIAEFLWSSSHLTTVLGVNLVAGFIFDREGAPTDPNFIGSMSLMKHARSIVTSYFGRVNHPVRIGVAFTESQLGCPHSVAHLEHVDTLVVKIDFEPEVKFPLNYQMFNEYMDGVINRTHEFVEKGKEMNISKIENISTIYLFRLRISSLKGNLAAGSLLKEKFPDYFNLLKTYVAKWNNEKYTKGGKVIIGEFKDDKYFHNYVLPQTSPVVSFLDTEESPFRSLNLNTTNATLVAYDFWNKYAQNFSGNVSNIDYSKKVYILLGSSDNDNGTTGNLTEQVRQVRRQLLTSDGTYPLTTLIFPSEDIRTAEFKKLIRLFSATKKHTTGCLIRFSNLTGSSIEWVKIKIRSEVECKPIAKFSTDLIWQFYLDFGKMTPFDYSFQWYSHFPKSGYQFHHYRPNLYSGMAKHNLFQVLMARNAFLKENPSKNVLLRMIYLNQAAVCTNISKSESCVSDTSDGAIKQVYNLFTNWAKIHSFDVIFSNSY